MKCEHCKKEEVKLSGDHLFVRAENGEVSVNGPGLWFCSEACAEAWVWDRPAGFMSFGPPPLAPLPKPWCKPEEGSWGAEVRNDWGDWGKPAAIPEEPITIRTHDADFSQVKAENLEALQQAFDEYCQRTLVLSGLASKPLIEECDQPTIVEGES